MSGSPTEWISALSRLEILHRQYVKDGSGSYMAQSTMWRPEEWTSSYPYKRDQNQPMKILPQHAAFVKSLPVESISRATVFQTFQSLKDLKISSVDAFISVMAWGFRPRSYGPYRTSVMLTRPRVDAELDDILNNVIEAVNTNPATGYVAIQGKLEGLGPAFGTKFLYFASPVEQRAPILDAVVAGWLENNCVLTARSKAITASGWNQSNYKRFVEFCNYAVDRLDCIDAGLIEYLMFVDSQYDDYIEFGSRHPRWIKNVSRLTT